MDKKIKILCIPSDRSGSGYHRTIFPHLKLDEMYGDDFDIEIINDIDWGKKEEISKFDLVFFQNGIYEDRKEFKECISYCKDKGTKFILDLDEYWNVSSTDDQYRIRKEYDYSGIIQENMKISDFVTVPTDFFAEKVKLFNKNVKVFHNSINKDFVCENSKKNKSKKLRFGFIMGSNHSEDMETFLGTVNRLPKDILDKVQFSLCGFNLNGTVKFVNKEGELSERPILPSESVWVEFEKNITDNYSIVSDNYKKFLNKFIKDKNNEYKDETYVRRWAKTIKECDYLSFYKDIDVLLIPIKPNEYNRYKSDLKMVECGLTGTAVVASDFGPYSCFGESFFLKGGKINENGKCVLVDTSKSHKSWAKSIEKLVENPEYVSLLKKNLKAYINKSYDFAKITDERAKWYKKIVSE